MPRSNQPTSLNIVIFGESQVGKTCFVDMFLRGAHFIRHDPFTPTPMSRTITHPSTSISTSSSSSTTYTLAPMDIDTTTPTNVTGPEWRNFLEGYLAGADGVILMYDITSKSSYERVIRETFARVWCCRDEVGEDGMRKRFGCVVVGNKADLLAGDGEGKREVDKQMAEEWAESQGFRACEVSSNSMEEVESVMGVLIDSVLKARRMDARDEEESRKEGIASLRDTLRRFVGKPTTST